MGGPSCPILNLPSSMLAPMTALADAAFDLLAQDLATQLSAGASLEQALDGVALRAQDASGLRQQAEAAATARARLMTEVLAQHARYVQDPRAGT